MSSSPEDNVITQPQKFTKDTVIKVVTDFSTTDSTGKKVRKRINSFLPYFYIIGKRNNASKIVKDAVLVKGIKWGLVDGLYESWAGAKWLYKNNEPLTSSTVKLRSVEEVNADLSEMWTVIPISVTKLDRDNSTISVWNEKSKSLLPRIDKKQASFGAKSHLLRILLSKLDGMQVMLDGDIYSSPCHFCVFKLKRIANNCPIAFQHFGRLTMCKPKLILESNIFKQDSDSTDTDNDAYSSDINLLESTTCQDQTEEA